jgi:hypothetical protein
VPAQCAVATAAATTCRCSGGCWHIYDSVTSWHRRARGPRAARDAYEGPV